MFGFGCSVAFYVVFIVLPKCSQYLGGLGMLGGVRRIVVDQLWQMFLRIAGVLLQVDIFLWWCAPHRFDSLAVGGFFLW